jgi:hypothetical protein
VKNLNKSEAIPKYMFLVSYPGKKDAFLHCAGYSDSVTRESFGNASLHCFSTLREQVFSLSTSMSSSLPDLPKERATSPDSPNLMAVFRKL